MTLSQHFKIQISALLLVAASFTATADNVITKSDNLPIDRNKYSGIFFSRLWDTSWDTIELGVNFRFQVSRFIPSSDLSDSSDRSDCRTRHDF